MIQHEFEELLEQFSQDELNEKSTVKGQFTSYITRRMEWHAIRYAAKNRPNVIVISLDQARDIWQILMPSKCFGRLRLNWLFNRKYRGFHQKKRSGFCAFWKWTTKKFRNTLAVGIPMSILRFKMWRVRRMCFVGQWCHLCQDAKRNKSGIRIIHEKLRGEGTFERTQ